jgi:hypothetical protein
MKKLIVAAIIAASATVAGFGPCAPRCNGWIVNGQCYTGPHDNPQQQPL